MLPHRASVSPINSTAETSGGTQGLLRHRLSFLPLHRADRNYIAKLLARSMMLQRKKEVSHKCRSNSFLPALLPSPEIIL